MARHKVRLADNIARVVWIDPEATKGAQLGTNLYTPDGEVGTPASVREWLGIGGGGSMRHRDLSGLQVGDDHPQYTMWAAKERITGQWNFEKQIWGADGSAALPEFTFTDDTDTGMYRLGANNVGFATAGEHRWDVNASRTYQNVPQVIDRIGDYDEWSSVLFTDSTLTIPRSRFNYAPDGTLHITTNARYTGPGPLQFSPDVSSSASMCIEFSMFDSELQFFVQAAGSSSFNWAQHLATFSMTTAGQLKGKRGSATAPTYSFIDDTNTGLYSNGEDKIVFTTAGTLRWGIDTVSVNSELPLRGIAGSAAAAAYSFTGQNGLGMYAGGTNILSFATAGTVKFQIGAAGQFGIGGANYGAARQVIVSTGASSAPTWDLLDAADVVYDNAISGLSADDVQDAVDELALRVYAADEITYDNSVSGLLADDVQEAIDELAGRGGGSGGLAYVNLSVPSGNTIANTTTETEFESSYTIPANQLQPGSVVRLRLFGVVSSDAVAPSLRLRVKVGGAAVLDTGAVALDPNLEDEGWTLTAQLVCFSDGETGELEAQGVAVFANDKVVNLANAGPAAIDTTDLLAITVSAEWNAADSDNTATLREMAIDILDAVDPVAAAPATATYLTVDDETDSLPNSRRLIAGSNINFDDSVDGERTINAIGGGGGGSANLTPDTHPETTDPANDEFEYGTGLDTSGSRFSGATPWAWRNQGSSTATVTQGQLVLTAPSQGAGPAPSSWRIVEQVTSGSTWKYRAKVAFNPNNFANYTSGGMVLVENSTGRVEFIGLTFANSFAGVGVAIDHMRFTDVNTFNSRPTTQLMLSARHVGAGDYIYWEIERTASQLIFRYSFTGAEGTFKTHHTENTNAFFSSAPDRIGLCADTENVNNGDTQIICDWFRKVA